MKYMFIVMFIIVGCSDVDATDRAGSFSNSRFDHDPVEIFVDTLSFGEAFNIMHRFKGSDKTFNWRGETYTTNLADTDEFVITHASTNHEKMGWVLNNDDPDDDCYYNKRDECGICNGPGKTVWFRDKDGDGLGTHKEWITSCYNPNNEDLRDYSGDLGVNK